MNWFNRAGLFNNRQCSNIKVLNDKTKKQEVVALVTEQGYSVSEATAFLGITTKHIYKRKAKLEEQQAGNSLIEDERAELKRLRKMYPIIVLIYQS